MVDKALAAAIASAERLVTGQRPAHFIPALRPACEELERRARRASDSRRLQAARFCLAELATVSGARPLNSVTPRMLDSLLRAQAPPPQASPAAVVGVDPEASE